MSIPNVIHKVIITDSGQMPNLSPEATAALDSFRKMNHDHEVRVYTGTDCEHYIKQFYGSKELVAFRALVPHSFKADLFKYLVLYNEGGVYSDFRQICLRPLSTSIPVDAQWVSFYDRPFAPKWAPRPMAAHLLATTPGQPTFKAAIDMILSNVATSTTNSHKQLSILRSPNGDPAITSMASQARKLGCLGVSGPGLLGFAFDRVPPTGPAYVGEFKWDPFCKRLDTYDHTGTGGLIIYKHPKADGSHYWQGEWGAGDGGGNDYAKLYNAGKVYSAPAPIESASLAGRPPRTRTGIVWSVCGAIEAEAMPIFLNGIASQDAQPDLLVLGPSAQGENDCYRESSVPTVRHAISTGHETLSSVHATIKLLREEGWDEDTIIIFGNVCKTNDTGVVRRLASLSPNSAWTRSASYVEHSLVEKQCISMGERATLLSAESGTCVRLSFFEDEFAEYVERCLLSETTRNYPSVLISNYLWRKNIPIRLSEDRQRADLDPVPNDLSECVAYMDNTRIVDRHFPIGVPVSRRRRNAPWPIRK